MQAKPYPEPRYVRQLHGDAVLFEGKSPSLLNNPILPPLPQGLKANPQETLGLCQVVGKPMASSS